MIELIDESDTFIVTHASGASFILRHWTRAMQDEVDQRCIIPDGKGGYTFNIALERDIKISKCLTGWNGISFKGVSIPFALEDSKRLPVGVFLWLVGQIDERAGLRMREDEKKN